MTFVKCVKIFMKAKVHLYCIFFKCKCTLGLLEFWGSVRFLNAIFYI